MPEKIDIISGFLKSLFETRLSPLQIVDFSSRYNSRIVMEVVTLTIATDAADSVASCSPCRVGKANIMNGMPKKARLPKVVHSVTR